jgi:hypothetical protein
MCTRAERAARVDDDRLPRRPDPEAPDLDAVVERAPAVLPAVRDIAGLDDVEADRRLVGVDRERAVQLLDALGEDVQQEQQLRLPTDDDISLQRNALFSLSKKPSSVL